MGNPPKKISIVEVGPRDGLQNEPEVIDTSDKLRFIELLSDAGLRQIEVTSFVHPKRVPQLADADALSAGLPKRPDVRYSALVPNERGLERALRAGFSRIAVFTAASETFNRKNINMGIDESLEIIQTVVTQARSAGASVRGYVSTCFVCPYEGIIAPEPVHRVARALHHMGIDEISLGDTIGAGTPKQVEATVGTLLKELPAEKIALHFHDTYGLALVNVYQGLQLGVTTFDSSAGGLGGCPYAPGAAGNLATEDLVYFLDRLGIETGVSLDKLCAASSYISSVLKRPLPSKVGQALAKRRRNQ